MKIILAIGSTQVEDALIATLPQKCKVVGIAPYREAVLTKLEEAPSTDVVLIRDNLKGSLPILKMIHQIRSNYPHCRIILMTKQREAGDPFLSEVVSFGIWDIIVGSKSSVSVMTDYILNPRTFKDVERYQIRKMISEKDIATSSQETTPVVTSSHQESSTMIQQSQEPIRSVSTNQINVETQTYNQIHPVTESQNHEEELIFKLDEDTTFDLTDTAHSSTHEDFMELEVPKKDQTPFSKGKSSKHFRSPLPGMEKPLANESPVEPHAIPIPIPVPTVEAPKKAESFMDRVVPKPPKPKTPTRDEVKGVKKSKPPKRKAFETEIKNSPVVMSLVGIRGGVGTTQTALNLAIALANKKNRVLYVELNDSGLPFTYLYQLGNLSNGLEAALEMAASPGLQDVSSYVTRIKDLKRSNDKALASIASKYPDTLDFLAFSQFFNRETEQNYYPESLKELLMGLLLSEGYQFIILDINLRSDRRLIEQALSSSRYIVPVITQNLLTVGQAIEHLSVIHSNMFDLSHKVYFLINRYNSDLLKDRSILKWANNELPFKVQNVWTIPNESKAYQVADDKNYPVLLCGAPKGLSQAFETIHNYLKTM